ncbi:hypothetical protein SEA_PAINTERBOY_43 [Mycobacterium phage PainterBoy]|nr:hypothetical protein SEA_LUCYEDI_43 [Mycobacterium phage Lucyedi]QNJ55831.1 hypothetical protein SEA_PAINTERBOY_43 [Mycobacterium phage PainterBoy]
MKSPTWTAVFSDTDTRAEALAEALGLVNYVAYGVDENPDRFEGARASRTIIESGTKVPIELLENIYGTTSKLYGGKVLWVSANEVR